MVLLPKNSRSEAEKIPPSIGGYKVGDMLGKGGFGEVRHGEHQLTLEKVALKFLRKSDIHSLGAAERTNTEIQCLTALKHTNIIRLLQHMESAHHVVLVFELMQGGDLMKYLTARRDPLPPHRAALAEDECKHVFYQILSGVSFAHNQHICHRDLKLENVLLKDNTLNLVKIADFGLSDFYRPGATMKSNCGTLSFLAPEVFRGTSNAGPPLDVWSLGVILFAILCGRLPFEGADLMGTKRPRDAVIKSRIIKCQYKIDEHLGPEAKDLVRRMLQVDPVERASLPEIFNHVWVRSASNSHYSDCTPTTSTAAAAILNFNAGGTGSRIAPVLSSVELAGLGETNLVTPVKSHRRAGSFLLSSSDNTGTHNSPMDPQLLALGLVLDPPPAPKSLTNSPGTPIRSPFAGAHKSNNSLGMGNGRLFHGLSSNDMAALDSPRSRDSPRNDLSKIQGAFSSTMNFTNTDLDLTEEDTLNTNANNNPVLATFKLVPLRRSNSNVREMDAQVSASVDGPLHTKLGNTHRSNSEKGSGLTTGRPTTAITFLPKRVAHSPFGTDGDMDDVILVSSHGDDRGTGKKVSSFTLPKREIVSANSGSTHHKTPNNFGHGGIADKDVAGSSPTRFEYKSAANKHGDATRQRAATDAGTHTASYMNPIGGTGGARREDKRHSGTAQAILEAAGQALSDSPNTVGGGSSPYRENGNRSRTTSSSTPVGGGATGGSSTAGGRVRFM
eukprot:gene24383-30724_t